jgi:hypothetical protein
VDLCRYIDVDIDTDIDVHIDMYIDMHAEVNIHANVPHIMKGSSSVATLSLALRSKGEADQPSYLIIQAIAVHVRTPSVPSTNPKSRPKTL